MGVAPNRERLLYLVHRIPYPPNKGDKIRSFHMLRVLAERYRILLGAFVDDPEDWAHAGALNQYCEEVKLVQLNSKVRRFMSLAGLLRGEALSLPFYRSAELQRWVDEKLLQDPSLSVLAFSSTMAQYCTGARSTSGATNTGRRVLDMVDVDSAKWSAYAYKKPWPLSWLYAREGRRLASYEALVVGEFDRSFLVSPEEATVFRQQAPQTASRVSYFCNGVDSSFFDPAVALDDPYPGADPVLCFVGAMDYWPNVDAVQWFASEILPLIRDQIGSANFFIVGARPAKAVLDLARLDGVTVTGSVDDVRPYVKHAHAVVAPLRIARGIQNKVLEAMAMAKPIIATPEAAEGIGALGLGALRVRAAPQEIAQACVAALQMASPEVNGAARRYVLEHHDWSATLRPLLDELAADNEAAIAPSSCQLATAS